MTSPAEVALRVTTRSGFGPGTLSSRVPTVMVLAVESPAAIVIVPLPPVLTGPLTE